MSLAFEGETLNVGGFELTGTVLVDARATDGSFSHAFGTERVMDLEFLPAGFVLDDQRGQTLKYSLVYRAVSAWISSHERQVMRAYEKEVKS